jgi:general secretion pathway protein I
MTRKIPLGFTLIEVLVAIAIVAIALTAGLRAAGLVVDSAARQEQSMFGELCTANALAEMRAARVFPSIGSTSTQNCKQAGLDFELHIQTSRTPNPSLRKITVTAFHQGHPVHAAHAIAPEF